VATDRVLDADQIVSQKGKAELFSHARQSNQIRYREPITMWR